MNVCRITVPEPFFFPTAAAPRCIRWPSAQTGAPPRSTCGKPPKGRIGNLRDVRRRRSLRRRRNGCWEMEKPFGRPGRIPFPGRSIGTVPPPWQTVRCRTFRIPAPQADAIKSRIRTPRPGSAGRPGHVVLQYSDDRAEILPFAFVKDEVFAVEIIAACLRVRRLWRD